MKKTEKNLVFIKTPDKHVNCYHDDGSKLQLIAPGDSKDFDSAAEADAVHFNLSLTPSHASRDLRKALNRAEQQDLDQAMKLICKSVQLLEDGRSWSICLLLAMLNRVVDLAPQEILPRLPVVQVAGLSCVPSPLGLLMRLTNDSDEWAGKGWYLSLPSVVSQAIDSESWRPSLDLVTYFGGKIRLWNGKRSFFWPPAARSVVLAPNLPTAVAQKIIAASPLVIPFCCGAQVPSKDRPVIKLDGAAFNCFDCELLQELDASSDVLAGIVSAFSEWFRWKKSHRSSLVDGISRFTPVVHSGRFSQEVHSEQSDLYAVALALFSCFLRFAVTKLHCLSEQDARDTLNDFWQLVLPESAPKVVGTSVAPSSSLDDLFWSCLQQYLETYAAQITVGDQPRVRSTMGCVKNIGQEPYLILPRSVFFDNFCKGNPLSENLVYDSERRDVRIQRALTDLGVQLKAETCEYSWRFKFYNDPALANLQGSKVSCLGIPVCSLPSSLQDVVSGMFGDSFGSGRSSDFVSDFPNR